MTTLSQQLLGKEVYDITKEDLVTFFSVEQEETALLEFKSGEVTLEDVYKEVAAFANTQGGILIIGAPRETEINRRNETARVCVGSLTASDFRSKDWLIQKIASQVTPLPVGLRVHEVSFQSGRCFVVEVPQSSNPPHQVAEKGVYYIRLDRQARPAPHSFVQALFGKRRIPILDCSLSIVRHDIEEDRVRIRLFNTSSVPADRVSFIVTVRNIAKITCDHPFRDSDDAAWTNCKTLSKSSDQILVRPLSCTIDMRVVHLNQPYFISFGHWCLDCDFQDKFWVYDPITESITENGNRLDDDSAATRFENHIHSITAPINAAIE